MSDTPGLNTSDVLRTTKVVLVLGLL